MTNIFVSPIMALALWDKGFDEECLAMYTERYLFGTDSLRAIGQHEGMGVSGSRTSEFKNPAYKTICAPTHQQVQDWFDNKGIHIYTFKYGRGWHWKIDVSESTHSFDKHIGFKTRREALEVAIEEALKLI